MNMLLCLLIAECLLLWIWVMWQPLMVLAWKAWLLQTQRVHYLAQKTLRLQLQMTLVEWALLATHSVDPRQVILPLPQWTQQMLLLAQLWTAPWIKVVRRHPQTLARLLLMTQVQQWLTMTKASQIHPLVWVK